MIGSPAFKAIAHPVRRDILRRLRAGPQTAGELATHYTISKPSLSAHFNALKAADLVYAEREGTSLRYHLNLSVAEELLSAVMDLLGVDPAARAESDDVPLDRPL